MVNLECTISFVTYLERNFLLLADSILMRTRTGLKSHNKNTTKAADKDKLTTTANENGQTVAIKVD